MKRHILRYFTFYIFLSGLFLSSAQAESSVWKISKDGRELYIGGTIHILSRNEYPLPREFYSAYQLADMLVFETDIEGINKPDFQQKMLTRMRFQNGKTLRSTLKPETYQALEAYARGEAIQLASLQNFRPQFISLMLTIHALKKLGIDSAGVDHHLVSLARREGKPVNWLETLDDQLNFLVNIGKGREDELILHTLEENHELRTLMDEMVSYWRTGDMLGLNDKSITPLKTEFPRIYEDLLVKRNNNWLPQIAILMKTDEVEFVLVGTMHLAGEDGLLQQLERRGYEVSRF